MSDMITIARQLVMEARSTKSTSQYAADQSKEVRYAFGRTSDKGEVIRPLKGHKTVMFGFGSEGAAVAHKGVDSTGQKFESSTNIPERELNSAMGRGNLKLSYTMKRIDRHPHLTPEQKELTKQAVLAHVKFVSGW